MVFFTWEDNSWRSNLVSLESLFKIVEALKFFFFFFIWKLQLEMLVFLSLLTLLFFIRYSAICDENNVNSKWNSPISSELIFAVENKGFRGGKREVANFGINKYFFFFFKISNAHSFTLRFEMYFSRYRQVPFFVTDCI